jgi:hypothetical protein
MSHEMVTNFPDGKEFELFKENFPTSLKGLDDIAAGYHDIMSALEEHESNRNNEFIFLMVGACYTEYEEILVLALNGYGSGATKLLRALYERVVTGLYLMRHPNKIQQFIDYTHVHWNKLLIEAETTGIPQNLSSGRRAEIINDFREVEAQFTETVCRPCKKTRLQLSWTKKPVPSQARELDEELGLLGFQSYLMPTFFLHTTFWSIAQQIKEYEGGKRELHNKGMERDYAKKAVVFATTLMGHLVSGSLEFFHLELKEISEQMMNAVRSIGRDLVNMDAEPDQPQERQPQSPAGETEVMGR